mmetsp:Transcript_31343/g.66560  ORF Transcript_31343/g.66560 Transcript_31343/m.66560 type:complete len:201 (+) Transcript_31343:295-897(+)
MQMVKRLQLCHGRHWRSPKCQSFSSCVFSPLLSRPRPRPRRPSFSSWRRSRQRGTEDQLLKTRRRLKKRKKTTSRRMTRMRRRKRSSTTFSSSCPSCLSWSLSLCPPSCLSLQLPCCFSWPPPSLSSHVQRPSVWLSPPFSLPFPTFSSPSSAFSPSFPASQNCRRSYRPNRRHRSQGQARAPNTCSPRQPKKKRRQKNL